MDLLVPQYLYSTGHIHFSPHIICNRAFLHSTHGHQFLQPICRLICESEVNAHFNTLTNISFPYVTLSATGHEFLFRSSVIRRTYQLRVSSRIEIDLDWVWSQISLTLVVEVSVKKLHARFRCRYVGGRQHHQEDSKQHSLPLHNIDHHGQNWPWLCLHPPTCSKNEANTSTFKTQYDQFYLTCYNSSL